MLGVWVLVATGVGLVALAVATRRRPVEPVPDLEGYFERWTPLHGGVDPRANPWLRGWLAMSFHVARPFSRFGVHPDVLTLSSAWLAGWVVVIAGFGGRWQILSGWLCVFSGLGDTLDGCVAVSTDRTSRWGYVLDSGVDRVNDVLYLVAIVAVGVPAWLAFTAGGAFCLLEYLRARARNAGGDEVGTVTVGERAVRVALCSAGIHWGGVYLGFNPEIPTVALAILALLSVIGLAQLVVAVRRQLAALPVETAPPVEAPRA